MIKHGEYQAFELELLRREHLTLEQKFRMLDALHAEAVALGALPLRDPLEGLEVDIRIAWVVNHVSRAP
ncbi:MAG: hypothetical protein ACP5E9_10125 [Candidatus Methanospirareceae archaeon]